VATGSYALGGVWTPSPQRIHAGPGAQLTLQFSAHHVYLVLGGEGTVTATLNGQPYKTVHVHGIPALYTLVSAPTVTSGVLGLSFTPGLDAYAFTFG
jgi:hypothetical protein